MFYGALVLSGALLCVLIVLRATRPYIFTQASGREVPVQISNIPALNKNEFSKQKTLGASFVAKKSNPRISIPSIGVDAPIDAVGNNLKGEMEVPSHLSDVGWYEYGTSIGGVGSAVIAGHVDNGLALPAVFYHLHEVKVGDKITVTTNQGTDLTFSVTDVSDYPLTEAPREAIFHDTSGKRLLRLITCERTGGSNGTYSYDNRIVVTASLVSPVT